MTSKPPVKKPSNSHPYYTRIPSLSNAGLSGPPKVSADKSVASSPPVDPVVVVVASIHYDEFGKFLVSYLPKANTPPTVKQKLMGLSSEQLQDLCTDVYDELIRRKASLNTTQAPFLPTQAEYHPKRNQARQKLSTLTTSRFQDLCSDVRYELGRRYPECKEGPSNALLTNVSTYDNSPSSDSSNAPSYRATDWTTQRPPRSSSRYPVTGGASAKTSATLL